MRRGVVEFKGNGNIVVQLPGQQCPYFESKTVILPVPSGSVSLDVPTCRLAEVMGARLNTLPAGQEVIRLLTTTPQEGETRVMYGPDIDAITSPTCTPE